MRVLMFGWEFPPHISGGLGTACYGMVRGLANNDVDVLFVMPSASGDEDGSVAHIINASDVEATDIKCSPMDFLQRINFLRIGSNLVPYVDPRKTGTIRSMTSKSTSSRNTNSPASTAPTSWRR